jgi:hypothetical protein
MKIDNLEDGIDGRIILKWLLNGIGLHKNEFIWLRNGTNGSLSGMGL